IEDEYPQSRPGPKTLLPPACSAAPIFHGPQLLRLLSAHHHQPPAQGTLPPTEGARPVRRRLDREQNVTTGSGLTLPRSLYPPHCHRPGYQKHPVARSGRPDPVGRSPHVAARRRAGLVIDWVLAAGLPICRTAPLACLAPLLEARL